MATPSDPDQEFVVEELTGPDRVRALTLDVASRLFAERGIHAVSVREIAREVGVSHTLLHLYFGSKEEILRQVLARHDSSAASEVKTAQDVSQAVLEAFRHAFSDHTLTKVLAAALIEGVVPGRIEPTPKLQQALSERLGESFGAKADSRVLVAGISAFLIGWAVAGEWLTDMNGMHDVSENAIVDQLAAFVEQLIVANS